MLFAILALLLVAGRPAAAQSLPSGVYRAGDDGVTFPRAVWQVAPGYPIEAMRAGVHGVVQLEAIVGADGSVWDVRVVKSLDRSYGLDAEAVRAAKAWRFEAGLKDGSPVPVALTIEMTFAISNPVTSANPSPSLGSRSLQRAKESGESRLTMNLRAIRSVRNAVVGRTKSSARQLAGVLQRVCNGFRGR